MKHPVIVDIRQILEDALTAEGIEQWLRAANRLPDRRRPIDLLNEGDTESVRKAAETFLDGAYVSPKPAVSAAPALQGERGTRNRLDLRHLRWRQGLVEACR